MRSSHRRFFLKKCFLKLFAKFIKEHMSWSLFFNKVAPFLQNTSGKLLNFLFTPFCNVSSIFMKTSLQKFRKSRSTHRRPQPATLLKKLPWHRCFPVNFLKFLRTLFYIKVFCWLFQKIPQSDFHNILEKLQRSLSTYYKVVQNCVKSWT